MGRWTILWVLAVGCGDGEPTGPGGGGSPSDAAAPPPCTRDERNDPANCGACGRACSSDQWCVEGTCVAREPPLDDYASCRAGTEPDLRCGTGRNCVTIGSGGPRVCASSCALAESRCRAAPEGSDARPTCTRLVLRCLLACTTETTCPAGQTCRLLPPGTAGYCAP